MSSVALTLVIIAALLHATWNLAAKKSGGAVVYAFCTGSATSVIWAPAIVGLLLFDPGISPARWGSHEWGATVASAAIHAAYFVVLLHGYRVAPLSVVYPVARGTGPLISSFCALLLFHEHLTLSAGSGILLIVVGVFLLAWQRPVVGGESSLGKGVWWGGVTGMTIALYTLVDGYAIKTLKLDPVIYDYGVSLIRALILFPFVVNRFPEVRSTFQTYKKGILIVALLSPLAYILVLTAMQIAPLSRVAPAREVSMLFGAFFGGKFLKEGSLAQRMSAAGLIACGVILLS